MSFLIKSMILFIFNNLYNRNEVSFDLPCTLSFCFGTHILLNAERRESTSSEDKKDLLIPENHWNLQVLVDNKKCRNWVVTVVTLQCKKSKTSVELFSKFNKSLGKQKRCRATSRINIKNLRTQKKSKLHEFNF